MPITQHPLLHSLNPAQQTAVSLPQTHALILAGAGSGKTRVLVHRLAWLFQETGVSPLNILAVTFTNKAAREMRERIETLLHISTHGMWVGTFHGLAHRLLRLHHQAAHLSDSFQILDSDDQYRLVRRALKNLNLDEQYWPPKQAQHFINHQKDAIRRPHQVEHRHDDHSETLSRVYAEYERLCQHNGVIDFAEIMLRCYELLRDHPEIRHQYQSRFRHILIDEFQDTNALQYAWIKLLAGKSNIVMAVGDDDQSIYGWRGAKIENIHHLQRDFQPIELVRLEQNYRSTQMILNAANAVIMHNPERLGKTLWTDGDIGAPIQLYAGFNEIDEARFVVDRIQQALHQGHAKSDIALLYRANAQSRVLEEALIHAAIPYRVYGGLRFFERAEIKDALAYLRLMANHDDDSAFERIVNTPARGIGERSIEIVRETARSQGLSLWNSTEALLANHALSGRAGNALHGFLELIVQIATATLNAPLDQQVDQALRLSHLADHYQKEPPEKAQARLENLAELVTAAKQFNPDLATEGSTLLNAFLAHAALEAGDTQADQHQDGVQLMTIHAAKGLEFPIVFITGMEDELFPPKASFDDPTRLAEERRLCYVGMTRAMRQLYLTHAEYRRLYGENRPHQPSRFIREIPKDCISEVRMKSSITQPTYLQPNIPKRLSTTATGVQSAGKTWFVGQPVQHPKFGQGIVLNYEGQGDNARLQVRFQSGETKWLVASYIHIP